MSWAIQVEHLSKQYRMGRVVNPAFHSVYQIFEQKVAAMVRRMTGSAEATEPIHDGTHRTPVVAPANLVLTPEQQEGCPDGHFWALRDVSFEIKEGERVGIVGKNGSGKSTLLKILSRITTPGEGKFRFRGRLVSLLEVGTGFHPDLSGRENIILNAKINGMSTRGIRRIFDDIVEFSELGPQIDTPIKRYSSGMYMRLAFSVAAHLESEILIVDEVLAVGDAGFQKKCLNKMLEISGRGRTLLFVSHDMNAISSLCTRAIEMSHGRIVDAPYSADAHSDLGSLRQVIDPQSDLRSVTQAISDYMLDGAASNVREWTSLDAPQTPDGPVILRRIAVEDENGVVRDHFDVSQDIRISVEFDLKTSSNALNVQVYVTTLTGQRLLASMDNLDIPKSLKPRPAGRYSEQCVINKDLLNQGVYRVEVVINAGEDAAHRIAMADAVSFSVTDEIQSSTVRGDWTAPWPDYPIRTRLQWNVAHQSFDLKL